MPAGDGGAPRNPPCIEQRKEAPLSARDFVFSLPQEAADAVGNAVRAGRARAEDALRGLAARLPRPAAGHPAAPLFASLTSALTGGQGVAARSAPAAAPRIGNPVFDLALTPVQIAPKLQHVPVWTITNTSLEFITVSGKEDAPRQLQLFFFNEHDAELLLAKVRGKGAGCLHAWKDVDGCG